MHNITNATLAAIQANFRTLFLSSFRAESSVFQQMATVRDTDSAEEIWLFISGLPRMRKWLGERVVNNFRTIIHRMKHEDWESTVEVERNDILDDKLNIYRPLLEDMGRQAARLWDDLLVDAINNGDTALGFDGQYFFDTDHPTDPTVPTSASQSNRFTARPLTDDNYAWGRMQMMGWMGGDGRRLGVVPNILLVGPELEVTAKRIINSDVLPLGANGAFQQNVLRGTAQVVVMQELTGATWYLADTRNTMRPFIIQRRQQPKFVALDNPTDDSVFWRKKYHYGADARGAAGYGPWFLIAKFLAV